MPGADRARPPGARRARHATGHLRPAPLRPGPGEGAGGARAAPARTATASPGPGRVPRAVPDRTVAARARPHGSHRRRARLAYTGTTLHRCSLSREKAAARAWNLPDAASAPFPASRRWSCVSPVTGEVGVPVTPGTGKDGTARPGRDAK